MAAVPEEQDFPDHPAAWYLFGTSAEVRRRPVSKERLGGRLVAFRTSGGEVAILDAACSHLAADLGRGRVVGDCLQCPFHHWEYAADGICRRMPAQHAIPPFAAQRAFPTVERHGLIFFWNGVRPQFPLPFFAGVEPDGFVRGRPFQFTADCSWVMLVANGFDGQHFHAVHDRRLLAPPQVDSPEPHARRVRYRAEIVGDSMFDRLLMRFAGRTVEISITNFGGPLVLVTGQFPRARSSMLIAAHRIAAHETLAEVVVFAAKARNPLLRWLGEWPGLEIRRLFTRGFFQDDIARLSGIRYRPRGLVESDQMMRDFFQWLAGLPRNDFPVGIAGPGRGAVNGRASGNGIPRAPTLIEETAP
jgi:phenylpropionate dioxygenase-like ring-hydroxylating dioxygenase large terminal subunit